MNLRPFLIVTGIAIVSMVAVSAWGWTQIPDDARIPVHWGVDSQPDGYASKPIGLLGLPLLALGLAGLLAVVPRIEPRRSNLLRSATAYRATASGILVLLAVLHGVVVVAATGREVDVTSVVAVAVGSLFALIGNFMGKVRSNFLFGIRTPWTLTSERSWARTHRLGGRLLVVLGLGLVVATLLGFRGTALFSVLGAGTAIFVGILFVYSWLVWRDDPDRRTWDGGTR